MKLASFFGFTAPTLALAKIDLDNIKKIIPILTSHGNRDLLIFSKKELLFFLRSLENIKYNYKDIDVKDDTKKFIYDVVFKIIKRKSKINTLLFKDESIRKSIIDDSIEALNTFGDSKKASVSVLSKYTTNDSKSSVESINKSVRLLEDMFSLEREYDKSTVGLDVTDDEFRLLVYLLNSRDYLTEILECLVSNGDADMDFLGITINDALRNTARLKTIVSLRLNKLSTETRRTKFMECINETRSRIETLGERVDAMANKHTQMTYKSRHFDKSINSLRSDSMVMALDTVYDTASKLDLEGINKTLSTNFTYSEFNKAVEKFDAMFLYGLNIYTMQLFNDTINTMTLDMETRVVVGDTDNLTSALSDIKCLLDSLIPIGTAI